MKILFLANLIPYPLDGGGKIFTYSVLKALCEKNEVELLCFYEHEDVKKGKESLAKLCKSIDVLPIRVTTKENMGLMMLKAGISIFSAKPLGISKYINSEMKRLIRAKLENEKYDCVFCNILAMYGYVDYIKSIQPRVKTVLYEQNCEALIYKRYLTETTSLPKKVFLKMETTKLDRFEKEAINATDELILLSEEDKKALECKRKCSVIPIGVEPSKYIKTFKNEESSIIRMLFIGTMTWAPNNEGIIWFLKNVMPLCSDTNKYELYIIGKNPSDEVKEFCDRYSNVTLLGYVESLKEYYEKCDVLVVPLFIGSGQRVKIIEAFAKGYPVISTSIGAEGLKYSKDVNIMIADNEKEFFNQINRCSNVQMLKKIGANGLELFKQEYSTEVIGKKIDSVIRA